MVQSEDMDTPHKIPQSAGNAKDTCEPKKVPQSTKLLRHISPDEGRRTPHSHDSAAIKIMGYYCRVVVRWVLKILAEVSVQDVIKETKIFLSQHPFAAMFLASVAVACGIPILIFVTFAVVTIFLTFGGFIIIEGAVLAAGSFALVMCLATMVTGFIAVSFFGGLLYITYMQVDSMVRYHVASGETAQPFDSRLPQVLASLRNLPNSNRQSRVRAMHTPLSSNGHTHNHTSK